VQNEVTDSYRNYTELTAHCPAAAALTETCDRHNKYSITIVQLQLE